MDIASFVNLFKSYCENYKYQEANEPFKPLSFFHFDMEDITNSLTNLKLPAFFLFTPEVDFTGKNADSPTESYEATFMVLLQLPSNDIRLKGKILNKAKSISDQFIRRMMNDCLTQIVGGAAVLDGLNVQGIKGGPVNRTIDGLYGWTVSFNIEQGFDGEIQTEVWGDLI